MIDRRDGITIGTPPKYRDYEDDLYKVVGISDKTETNGAVLYECECKSCGKTHLRNAKHLKQQTRSRECDNYRSPNWSGLERQDAHLRRKYGITQNEFNALIDFQDNKCAICGDKLDKINIDHNHQTDEVRGLLCSGCNTGLGHLGDDIDGLEKALYYLKNTPYGEFKHTNAR